MSDDITVRGAEQLDALSRALRSADKDLRRGTYAAIGRAVKPLTRAVKDSAADYLPDAYAAEVARSLRVRTRRRGGRSAGLTLKGSAKTPAGKARELRRLEQGRLRKPLYGDRRNWFEQPVKSGFWSEPLADQAPAVRKELVKVIEQTAIRIARSI